MSVYSPASLEAWFGSEPTPGYSNLQDAVAQRDSRAIVEDLEFDAMLFGPNWFVVARDERDSIPALSSIRDEIGGLLVVAASPTASPSALSPTLHGSSA